MSKVQKEIRDRFLKGDRIEVDEYNMSEDFYIVLVELSGGERIDRVMDHYEGHDKEGKFLITYRLNPRTARGALLLLLKGE